MQNVHFFKNSSSSKCCTGSYCWVFLYKLCTPCTPCTFLHFLYMKNILQNNAELCDNLFLRMRYNTYVHFYTWYLYNKTGLQITFNSLYCTIDVLLLFHVHLIISTTRRNDVQYSLSFDLRNNQPIYSKTKSVLQ